MATSSSSAGWATGLYRARAGLPANGLYVDDLLDGPPPPRRSPLAEAREERGGGEQEGLRARLQSQLYPRRRQCASCELAQNQLQVATDTLQETERRAAELTERVRTLETRVEELEAERDFLQRQAAEPQDLATELLQQRRRDETTPARDAEVLRLLGQALSTQTGESPPSRASARTPSAVQLSRAARKQYKTCEIPADMYHKSLTAVGFTEVVFQAYAAHRGMGEKRVSAWIVDGRISPQFHLECMQSVAPDFAWKRQYLLPSDQGNPIEFFFWKVHALQLTLELVLMLTANENAVTTSAKSHVSVSQLQMTTERFKQSRVHFVRSLEQAQREYFDEFADWPPASEYSKSEPRSWVSRDILAFGKTKESAKSTLLQRRVGPGMLQDHTGDGDHLFANDSAAAEAVRLGKKKLNESVLHNVSELYRKRSRALLRRPSPDPSDDDDDASDDSSRDL